MLDVFEKSRVATVAGIGVREEMGEVPREMTRGLVGQEKAFRYSSEWCHLTGPHMRSISAAELSRLQGLEKEAS